MDEPVRSIIGRDNADLSIARNSGRRYKRIKWTRLVRIDYEKAFSRTFSRVHKVPSVRDIGQIPNRFVTPAGLIVTHYKESGTSGCHKRAVLAIVGKDQCNR